jgi:hypothetical protein
MKAILPLRLVVCSFLALAQRSPAQGPGDVPTPPRLLGPSVGGLQITLTTSGYKFFVPAPTAVGVAGLQEPIPPIPPPVPPRDSFRATVLFQNRSNTAVTFVFPGPNAAANHFVFRVFDAGGKLIWQNPQPRLEPVTDTPATLGRRSGWRRSVQVPLMIGSDWLAPGRYTLEAAIDGEPQLGASTVFEVALPAGGPPPGSTDTGIDGVVLQRPNLYMTNDDPPEFMGPEVIPRPVKASLIIEEIRSTGWDSSIPPFRWTGTTDDLGRFHVVTPAGRFRIRATSLEPPDISVNPIDPVPPPITGSADVIVTAGAFAHVDVYLPGRIFLGPPRSDTGIRGLVLAPPGGPAAEIPLSGAPVVVEEIRPPITIGIAPLFRWSGKTDAEGRFQVNTYAGQYRVTARQLSGGVEIGKKEVDVTVKTRAFTDVTLVIDNAMVGPLAR